MAGGGQEEAAGQLVLLLLKLTASLTLGLAVYDLKRRGELDMLLSVFAHMTDDILRGPAADEDPCKCLFELEVAEIVERVRNAYSPRSPA